MSNPSLIVFFNGTAMSGSIKTGSGTNFPDLVLRLTDATSIFWLVGSLKPNEEMQMSSLWVGGEIVCQWDLLWGMNIVILHQIICRFWFQLTWWAGDNGCLDLVGVWNSLIWWQSCERSVSAGSFCLECFLVFQLVDSLSLLGFLCFDIQTCVMFAVAMSATTFGPTL